MRNGGLYLGNEKDKEQLGKTIIRNPYFSERNPYSLLFTIS